jgi:predicted GIY-YIG superfamily endonuclease
MDKVRLLQEIMVGGETLTAKQVAQRIKDKYPQEWEEKAQYYLSQGQDDDYVLGQVRGEVGATFYSNRGNGGWVNRGFITRQKNEEGHWVYTITPEYQSFLKNILSESFSDLDVDIPETEEVFDEFVDECQECTKEYFVYLMKSSVFPNTYKIGYTDNLLRREKELLSPSKKVYNIFDFKVFQWVQLVSKLEMEQLEKNLHSYFHKNRLFIKNGCAIDTEIFVNDQMEQLFSNFVYKNYVNDPYQSGVVTKHKLI